MTGVNGCSYSLQQYIAGQPMLQQADKQTIPLATVAGSLAGRLGLTPDSATVPASRVVYLPPVRSGCAA